MRTAKLAASLTAALLMQACGNPTAEEPSSLTTRTAALTTGVSHGCTFTVSYRKVTEPYYGYIPSVTRQASDTCAWGEASVDLPSSYELPSVSLAANELGVAVSATKRNTSSSGQTLQLYHLAPDTLAVVRQTELQAYQMIRLGYIWTGELSIQDDGTTLKVKGTKDGLITGEVGSVNYTYYTALYPNFFTSTTAPSVTSSATAEQTSTGLWSASGNLLTARAGHTATLLSSGEVLVVGNSTAELFNPYGNTSRVSSASFLAGSGHTATRLSSGQVLVTGGVTASGAVLADAQLYDPATDTVVPAGALGTPRANHTATLLDSGQVLVTGGTTTAGDTDSAELYDPATGTWSYAGSLGARAFHAATKLYSGQVLVTGGRTSSGAVLSDARLYDPATNTWTWMPGSGRARSGHTAIRLYSGTVMLVGGGSSDIVDMYDPYNNRWYWTHELGNGRYANSATMLYSGNVLVTLSTGQTAQYNASTDSWKNAGSLSAALTGQTATLLDSGNVLVTGGSTGGTAVSTVQRYTP